MLKRQKLQLTVVTVALAFSASLFASGCTMKSAHSDDTMALVQRAEQAAARAEEAALRAEKAADKSDMMADKSERIFNKKMKK
ncbi:alanine-zipper protein [Desulfosediminicola flagellatus]|uniref:alanine-zipper protein n=1 Tax=Desulfosediminicola flagellatus TaxID=2569541 RepID=UPI0010AC2573|nr:alanine-zipper protein [Desulfosediminicola flagellatus]